MLSLSLCRDEICPAIFQTWKKSGNWRLSLEKGLKVLSLFLKRHQVLYKWNFVHFGQISNSFLPVCVQRIMKGFVPAFFKVVIDHLFDNLSLEKEIIVYYFNGKKSGTSWILDPKIFTNVVCVRKLEVVSELKTYRIMQIVTILY